MRNLIKRLFAKSEDESTATPSGGIRFVLKLEDLVIGYLTVENGIWIFRYSEEFKSQNKFRRLAGFSDLNKVYKSEELWPFFKVRIPGLKQPMIREILLNEHLDEKDEAVLLRRFGRQTMSNPYTLEPAY